MTDMEIFRAVQAGDMTPAEAVEMIELEQMKQTPKFKKILRVIWILAKNIVLGPLA